MIEDEHSPGGEIISLNKAAMGVQAIIGMHRLMREAYNKQWAIDKQQRRAENIRLNPDIMRRALHGKKP